MQDNLLIIHHESSMSEDIINLDRVRANTVIFSFNEYEPISITLRSNTKRVKMECLSFKDMDGKFHWCNDNELYLTNEVGYIISALGDEVCYSPSKYQITIDSSEGSKLCYFEVRHNKEVTDSGISNVIERINSFIEGLTIDFFRNMPINSISGSEAKAWYLILELLAKEGNNLKRSSELASKKIKSSLTTRVLPTRFEGRQSPASIRRNILNNNRDKVYSVVKTLDYNNNENILLKKYILKILESIKEVSFELEEIIKIKKAELEELNKEHLAICQDMDNNLSKFGKKESKGHIKNIDAEIAEAKRWLNKLLEWRRGYEAASFNLNRILSLDEMKEVNISNRIQYSSKFMMDYSYRYFYDFYELLSKRGQAGASGNGIFTDKRTYSLFEIYGFVILQNIIKELGFSYAAEDRATLFSFASGKSFSYTRAQYRIEIQYDYYCRKYDDAGYDEVVNVNSYSNKPDYIIKIYEDDQIKSILILEIKYRNIKNMSMEGVTTETDSTINDYSQLRYNVGEGIRPQALIDDVFVLYPSKDEDIIEKPMGCYVGINVDEEFSNSRGYSFIKEAIERYTFE